MTRRASDEARADGVGVVIVVRRHRDARAYVREQLRRHSRILGGDQRDPGQNRGGARAEIAEIADRRRDDIQAGGKRVGG